jgi:ATP-dependent DNA helicase RecG
MLLTDSITKLPYISEKYAQKLARLNIYTIKDLITFFPRGYYDSTNILNIRDIIQNENYLNETVHLKAFLQPVKSIRLRQNRTLQTSKAYDETGEVDCIWFNQPYLKKYIQQHQEFMITAKLRRKGKKFCIYPSLLEPIKTDKELIHTARIVPKYPLTSGLSEKWLRNRIKYLIENISKTQFQNELKTIGVDNNKILEAIRNIHFPKDYLSLEESIQTLTLVELVHIQLKLIKINEKFKKYQPININKKTLKQQKQFIETLPFELTTDQRQAIENITKTMIEKKILNALIQGDVGSGKTIVAIAAALPIVLSNYQVIFLAPTTILAEQQFRSFKKLFAKFNISIDLVIGAKKKANEQADILIGTTAILSRKSNLIKKPGLIIVDEQHRFGVNQREDLLAPFENILENKNFPHFINMSATPIPRTIAQSLFGDIDVIEINTKPRNRKKIKTYLIDKNKEKKLLDWLTLEMRKHKNQVYWVCPIIEENTRLNIKSSTEIFDFLQKTLLDFQIGLLHGKMKNTEKQSVIKKFKNREIDILVTTSVIEVGIDVPNATIMVIENAERFGLAQLHQIRGRVGRGDKQSHCFLFVSSNLNSQQKKRIEFFAKNTDGLKIAQFDLENRGPGEVYGTAQTGIPNLKIAQLNKINLLKKSKKIAQILYNQGVKQIILFS